MVNEFVVMHGILKNKAYGKKQGLYFTIEKDFRGGFKNLR